MFDRYLIPKPSASQIKEYKTYLTRLSKWVAHARKSTHPPEGVIGESALREYLLEMGELASCLDDNWRKRVFGDKGSFALVADGFWKVLKEDTPSKPTEWAGARPGEDVIGDALRGIHRELADTGLADTVDHKSHLLLGEDWRGLHPTMLRGLQYAQKRGMKKPLNHVQDRAFYEALLTDDWPVQIIALWFTNTRLMIDALARFRDTVAGKAKSVANYELHFFAPTAVRAVHGVLQPVADVTMKECLENIRAILVDRGVVGGS